MTKIAYREKKFNPEHKAIIRMANEIIASFQRRGFTLTLRQLYYQFIARDIFPNTEQSYKRLGSIINDARLAGLVSWEAIEDRSRSISRNSAFENPADLLKILEPIYHIDMWQNQRYRPEVWVEKDALVGVVAAACKPLDVTYFACRGYVSQSEQWRSAMRLRDYEHTGQIPIIFHLGDHDPSGIDMTRDNDDRLEMFMGGVEVRRLGLNYDQVLELNPPENPAKITDSRSGPYIERFWSASADPDCSRCGLLRHAPDEHCAGTAPSWELDALDPDMLVRLITDAVLELRDEDAYQACLRKREAERERLVSAVEVARHHLGPGGGYIEMGSV